ncbi:T9SS type A sorting domain-containing protein [Flavobacterium sp. NG2]|uniref:T9SS type A sorting domain-containing protein n=1 Tax=Flavobacterium sp. NG2 TaxID=3097547 RepID=UPI002A7F710E|nr:T9SS type A sorting domain-containing protein [Flavobacterium sp. NG2]WPR71961.1 T9SS type A sorting domain-containing protein [Flavobacterium sp. NG2]
MYTINKITFTLITALLFCTNNINSQKLTTLNTTVKDKTNLDIGFNRRSDNGTWWTDNSFKNLVAEMNPDVVRYPGGTQANYWDWRTGKFIPNAGKNGTNNEVLKIPGFVSVLPARTKIVYVVNMARPTPASGVDVNATEATLKSTATLNLKINDMLAAIAEFVAQGKEPYAVELGNEFYFGNEESGIFEIVESNGFYYGGWNAATNQPYQANSKKDATVFTAKFYVEQCNSVVAAIKAQYPNIKFAICTTKLESNAQTREVWNNTVFDELNKPNYASLKSNIYAVTQHHYLNTNYGVQTVISDNPSAEVAIAEGIQYPIDKLPDYNLVPNNYKIWYTEYGEVKEIADETWASAVRYAALVHSFMNSGDKVGQLDYHYISDKNVVKVLSPMKLAPVGIAAKLVAKASADMTVFQEINFENNTLTSGSVKSLYGFKFKSNTKEALLIINTSDSNFETVKIDNLFTYAGQPTITEYYSTAPAVSGVYEGDSSNNIATIIGSVTGGIVNIKKFSISVIEAANTTLGVDNHSINNSAVYPNPVTDFLKIQSEDTIESVSIWNIGGILVYNNDTFTGDGINLSSLLPGVYLVKIKTNKRTEIKKIVKF